MPIDHNINESKNVLKTSKQLIRLTGNSFKKSSLPTIKTPSHVIKSQNFSDAVNKGSSIVDKISSVFKSASDGIDKAKRRISLPIKNIAQKGDTELAKILYRKIKQTPDHMKHGQAWENLKNAYRNAQGRRIIRMGDGVPLTAIDKEVPGLPDIHNVKLSQLSSYIPEDIEKKIML